uniref:Retron-type reverse transcriptase n=1 Tax=Klebsiella pneumoniae TaxID=573 RepID=A0A486T4L8_KLEPN|nr:Retron-type reverse transcriptase [Klebsiella pneumoniae]
MYGEEKSDSLIVAAKQANNPKGAESVERRSGAKGNAEQPHMRRTQSRESMSQRLSRVREAAKQRKKERFTALFHLLTVEALEAAFLSLSRKAAAGVDGIRWMDYAGNMKNNITELHRRLHQGSYRARVPRRCSRPVRKKTSGLGHVVLAGQQAHHESTGNGMGNPW